MRAHDITTHGHEGTHACIGELSYTLVDRPLQMSIDDDVLTCATKTKMV